jgi:hypothetical protein
MSTTSPDEDRQIRAIINSKDRNDVNNTTSTSFSYNLDREIKRVVKIELLSIQIPYTYYTITALNNVVEISAGTNTIPIGNYTTSSMALQLKTTMDAIGGGPYTLSFSRTTHKLTVSAAGAFQVLTVAANNIAKNLGFTVDSTLSTDNTGDIVFNLSGTNYIVIRSDALTEYNARPNVSAVGLTSRNILYTMVVKGNPTNILVDEPEGTIIVNLNTKRTFQYNIDFSIEDDSGNPIDLNGLDWSCQLLFRIK